MFALLSPVSVHPVGINHKFEAFSGLLERIYHLEGILEMHVVVAGPVRQFQVNRGMGRRARARAYPSGLSCGVPI